MAKLTLDMETFKALASETRLQVLRALDERRKTLSELSRELELNKATVHEHLQLLTGTGLIKKRDDEGRKWIYYELTWRGERLLHPQETTTFAVLLGIAIVAASLGVVFFGSAFDIWMDQAAPESDDTSSFEAADIQADQEGASQPSAAQDNGTQDDASPAAGNSQELRVEEPAPPVHPDARFWQDDGTIAVLLASTALLAVILATRVRRGPPQA